MDHYEVMEVIGEGTYGVVFKCRDKRTGSVVAIKQFKNFQTNAYIRVTMLRELRVEQLLKGEPNVTQLLETFKQKNRLYLVMEYIPRSLLDVLEEVQHGVDTEALVVLMYTILLGIRSCHRNGIIHRDVKPENILVRDDGTASLCDFGFCRPLPQPLLEQQQQQGFSSTLHDASTSALAPSAANGGARPLSMMQPSNGGGFRYSGASVSRVASSVLSELVLADHQSIMTNYVATRWYRSPEMLLNMTSYTYAVDMWAVGAIMAEAIDGEPLLPGKTELEQLSLIQSRVGDFPASYEAAVRKRNGGVLRLRSLNPLAARAPQLGRTSLTNGTHRASLAGRSAADGGSDDGVESGMSSYLMHRFGSRVPKLGLDLLHRLLRVDGAERIGVDEALEHPFFDTVRGRYDEPLSVSRAVRSPDEAVDDDDESFEDTHTLTDDTTELTGPTPLASPQEPGPLSSSAASCGLPLSALAASELNANFLAPAVAPARLGVPSSRTAGNATLDFDGVGSAPLPRKPSQHREADGTVATPQKTGSESSAAAGGSAASSLPRTLAAVASNLSTSSLSLQTNADEKDDGENASQQDGALPHLPDVLVSPPPRVHGTSDAAPPPPPPRKSSGEEAGAQASTTSPSPSPRPPPALEALPASTSAPPLHRQAASDGANWPSTTATAAARDTTTQSEQSTSAMLFHTRRSRDDLPEALQLLRRGTPLQRKDGDASGRRPPVHTGRNSAVVQTSDPGLNFSATLPSVRMRRPTKRGTTADTTDSQVSSKTGNLVSSSHVKSPLSALAQSYSFQSSPCSPSRQVTQSLNNAVSHSISTDDAVCTALNKTAGQPELSQTTTTTTAAAPGHGGAETRASPPSRSLSHVSGSDKVGPTSSAAAKTGTGTDRCSSAADTSTSTRPPPASIGGGGGGAGHVVRGARAARTPVGPTAVMHTALVAGSRKAAAAALADGATSRRQGTASSSRPPQPRWRSLTPTGAAPSGRSDERSPKLPKPLAVQSSPETSVGASVNEARSTVGRGTGAPRFASPKLPRKVRPLPATERVTLLKEIESLGYSVGVPSEVEVLPPAATPRGAEDSGQPPRYRRIKCVKSSRRRQESKPAPHRSLKSALTDDAADNNGHRTEASTASPKTTARLPPPSEDAPGGCSGQARHSTGNAAAASPTIKTATTTSAHDETDAEDRAVKEVRVPPTGTGENGRPLRMELGSLAGLSNTASSTVSTQNGGRAAPSLFFRSSRTPSSPLKLTGAQPSMAANPADTASAELSTSGRHPSSSTSIPNASLLASPASGTLGYAGRLAPALLRHHHPHQHASGRVVYTPPSLLPDACSNFGAAIGPTAISPHSFSSSQRLQRGEGEDTRLSSQDTPMVSLSCTRQQQRRLSQNPIDISLSGETGTDPSTPPLAHGGHRVPRHSSPPAAPPPPVSDVDELETVLLVETPPTKRRNVPCAVPPQPQLNSSSWSPGRSGTTAAMSNSERDNSSTPPRLDCISFQTPSQGDSTVTPMVAANGSDVVPVAHRSEAEHSGASAVPTSVPSADEDDMMNVSSATPSYCSPENIGKLGAASNATRGRQAPTMGPPQPLLGGAGVLSPQQLRAVHGRKKSRLVL